MCYNLLLKVLNKPFRKPKQIDASYTSGWREHAFYDVSNGETNISDDPKTGDRTCFGWDPRYIQPS